MVSAVSNELGKSVLEQSFAIIILPNDNKAPSARDPIALNVDRGGITPLTDNILAVDDVDTLKEAIKFSLEQQPQHGSVMKVDGVYRTTLRDGMHRCNLLLLPYL